MAHANSRLSLRTQEFRLTEEEEASLRSQMCAQARAWTLLFWIQAKTRTQLEDHRVPGIPETHRLGSRRPVHSSEWSCRSAVCQD